MSETKRCARCHRPLKSPVERHGVLFGRVCAEKETLQMPIHWLEEYMPEEKKETFEEGASVLYGIIEEVVEDAVNDSEVAQTSVEYMLLALKSLYEAVHLHSERFGRSRRLAIAATKIEEAYLMLDAYARRGEKLELERSKNG